VLGAPSCAGALHGFVVDDESGIYTPTEWAKKAISLYRERRADRVVAEVNNGGDLVESNIRSSDKNVSYKAVHASRGKLIRAEPVSSLYEQGKVHHVGTFAKLEDQLVQWNPLDGMKSPDRLDALVWGMTELMIDSSGPAGRPPRQPSGTSRSAYAD
jgi:phage terminase large subunit-like protein